MNLHVRNILSSPRKYHLSIIDIAYSHMSFLCQCDLRVEDVKDDSGNKLLPECQRIIGSAVLFMHNRPVQSCSQVKWCESQQVSSLEEFN